MPTTRPTLVLVPIALVTAMCSTFVGVPSSAPDAGAGAAADGGAGAYVNPAAYAAVVLADTPLVYFHLEEDGGTTAFSAAPSSPSASIMGTPTLGVPGRVGHAYAFPGGNALALVQIADADLADAGFSADEFQFTGQQPFSLEAWFYMSGAPDGQYRHIVIKDSSDQGNGRMEYGMWVHDQNGPTVGFERYTNNVGAKGTASVSLSEWHHAVGVYDGANVTLWLDGRNVSTAQDTASTGAKDLPLIIGTRQSGCCEFQGTIDEVAIYDHVLTEGQILAHYAAGK